MDDIRNPKHPRHVATVTDLWDNRDKTEQMYSKKVRPIVDADPGDENDFVYHATDEEIDRSFDSYR